ncbi:hypothetical protein QBC32DRAFT_223633 [Pseudoneurospora amorphoporcata]|uniref:HNH nuclease domain-containing protein n=1 Tax=Pseudoneurospora amorphoporcata TaxID=241081 RepID=A0AAN6NMP8_9PEZI|nr:hypothetical protein QBC32DRAFT_223633 [Pseudoneurospora amorphoporcata]
MDDDELVLKHLFGKERGASEIGSPTNSLMLSKQVKSWFDKYLFVIVPVIDPLEVTQVPNNIITRWKVELISPDVENMTRELVFLNQNRPASRFLFFRFMLALIRIRQLDRRGWEDVWAKYHTYKPFAATPTGRYYARTGMLPLLAMAGHNGITAPEEEIEEFLRLNEAEEVPRIISLLRF